MRRLFDVRRFLPLLAALTIASGVFGSARASATPAITMDVATGDVLFQEDATQPWFPASTTKLMTVYVALSAVRDHQIAMDTPLVVSARAHRMPPSKMGFPVGSQVTLDNALKMLMVRSANDIAITVAEGIGGSVEAFADDMNQAAAQLGMHESHFVNPNGLPAADHYSSARDMAILARALYAQFPEQAGLFNIGELSLGSERIPNHNNLLGRYPGVDGMKTGFTCAAGFNVVASAYRDGRRLVVVVFGAPSVATRTQKVAALLDRGFAGIDRPIGSIVALPTSTDGGPRDMHDQVCRNRGPLIASFEAEVAQLDAPLVAPTGGSLGLGALNPERAFLFSTNSVANADGPMATRINTLPPPVFDPVPVHIGAEPGYTGVVAEARAPHSPIGTETPPVTAEAYAAAPAGAPPPSVAGSPLGVDPTALPLKGRRLKAARVRRGRIEMKAAAEAPTTKVMAGADAEDGAAKETAPKEKAVPEKAARHGKKQAVAKAAVGGATAKGKASKPKVEKAKAENGETDKTRKAGAPEKKPAPRKATAKKEGPAKAAATKSKTKPKVAASR